MSILNEIFSEKPFLKGLRFIMNFNGDFTDSLSKRTPDKFGSGYSFESSQFGKAINCTSIGITISNLVSNLGSSFFNLSDTNGDFPFTFVFRIKQTERRTNSYLYVNAGYSSTSTPKQIAININTNGYISVIRYVNNDNRLTTLSNIPITLNDWCNIIISCDGTKNGLKIYINNTDVTSSTSEMGTYTQMPSLYSVCVINDSALLNSRQFVGVMDFFGFWKRRYFTENDVKMFNARQFEIIN